MDKQIIMETTGHKSTDAEHYKKKAHKCSTKRVCLGYVASSTIEFLVVALLVVYYTSRLAPWDSSMILGKKYQMNNWKDTCLL